MKKLKTEPLPAFDSYTIDFDASHRPQCFHLFWNDEENATIRLLYDANGFLNRAVREGTKRQRFINLKELANLPFFMAYIHRINLIDEITEIKDIKTVGIDNIVIDLLKQGAFFERRSEIVNNGVTPTKWNDPLSSVSRYGKFFPRGCRGFLKQIGVYCKNTGGSDGTITVYVAPKMGMGFLYSAQISVLASATEAWRTVDFKKMWDYDSMFIFVYPSAYVIQFALDDGSPLDGYLSQNLGLSWAIESYRPWFKALMTGQTVSDIPVSGTINTIETVPVSSNRFFSKKTVEAEELTFVDISGVGWIEYFEVYNPAQTNSHHTVIYVHCDGNDVFEWDFYMLNQKGFSASTPKISLLKYAVDGDCCVHVTLRCSFRHNLKIALKNAWTPYSQPNVEVEGMANLMY